MGLISQCLGERMYSHDTPAVGLSDRHNKVVLVSDGRIALSCRLPCTDVPRFALPATMLLIGFLSPFTNPFTTTEPRLAGLTTDKNLR